MANPVKEVLAKLSQFKKIFEQQKVAQQKKCSDKTYEDGNVKEI